MEDLKDLNLKCTSKAIAVVSYRGCDPLEYYPLLLFCPIDSCSLDRVCLHQTPQLEATGHADQAGLSHQRSGNQPSKGAYNSLDALRKSASFRSTKAIYEL